MTTERFIEEFEDILHVYNFTKHINLGGEEAINNVKNSKFDIVQVNIIDVMNQNFMIDIFTNFDFTYNLYFRHGINDVRPVRPLSLKSAPTRCNHKILV